MLVQSKCILRRISFSTCVRAMGHSLGAHQTGQLMLSNSRQLSCKGTGHSRFAGSGPISDGVRPAGSLSPSLTFFAVIHGDDA